LKATKNNVITAILTVLSAFVLYGGWILFSVSFPGPNAGINYLKFVGILFAVVMVGFLYREANLAILDHFEKRRLAKEEREMTPEKRALKIVQDLVRGGMTERQAYELVQLYSQQEAQRRANLA
jgi:hypothetical protein